PPRMLGPNHSKKRLRHDMLKPSWMTRAARLPRLPGEPILRRDADRLLWITLCASPPGRGPSGKRQLWFTACTSRGEPTASDRYPVGEEVERGPPAPDGGVGKPASSGLDRRRLASNPGASRLPMHAASRLDQRLQTWTCA